MSNLWVTAANGGEPPAVLLAARRGPLYHGARWPYRPGDLVEPGHLSNWPDQTWDKKSTHVYAVDDLKEATGFAEQAKTPHQGRVFEVEPTARLLKDKEGVHEDFQPRESRDRPHESKPWQQRRDSRRAPAFPGTPTWLTAKFELSATSRRCWGRRRGVRDPCRAA